MEAVCLQPIGESDRKGEALRTRQLARALPVDPLLTLPRAHSPSLLSLSLSFPIDTIKTRLQLDHTGQYRGIVDCGRQVARQEGGRALWKGLTPFATHLTLKYALRMGTNAVYSTALRDKDGRLTDGRRMLAGLCAGVTEALVIVTPFETTKIRLQQQRGLDKAALKYHGPVHAASTILREEGVRGLWSGAAPTMLRNGTNQVWKEGGRGGRGKMGGRERVGGPPRARAHDPRPQREENAKAHAHALTSPSPALLS